MHEEGVGDSREPLDGFLLVENDGLLAPVSAGGDDGVERRVENQRVERGVRKHHPVARLAGSDRGSDPGVCCALQENDGTLGTLEERCLFGANAAELAHPRERTGEKRERLLLAVLALPETNDRGLRSRVDH